MNTLETAAATYPKAAQYWWLSAALYLLFCMVQTMPILTIMGSQSSSRQTAMWGGIAGGLVFNLLVTLSAIIVFFRIDTLDGVPMPTLSLVMEIAPWLGHVMSLVIFGMILNTAVGSHYAFIARIAPSGKTRFRLLTTVLGALALLCSFFGFVALVNTVYPMYGYVGFVLILFTLVGWARWGRSKANFPS